LLRADYIAESVDEFLTEIGTEAEAGEEIHLGFTFSYAHRDASSSQDCLGWH
jgi:hexokinase